MTDRELALCDLAFAHGMKLAAVMLAQGADEKVNNTINCLTRDALAVLKAPTRTTVAMAMARHDAST